MRRSRRVSERWGLGREPTHLRGAACALLCARERGRCGEREDDYERLPIHGWLLVLCWIECTRHATRECVAR